MDLIAMDIGNSTISVGVFTNKELKKTRQFEIQDSDDLADEILAMRELCKPSAEGVRTTPVVACSVNEKTLKIAQEAVIRQRLIKLKISKKLMSTGPRLIITE